jgi:hypothetical protein
MWYLPCSYEETEDVVGVGRGSVGRVDETEPEECVP